MIIPLLKAAGQQSADVSAAWAAYFAQYSNLFSQTGAQPGTASSPYAGQNLIGAANAQPVPQADQSIHQQSQPQSQQSSQPQVSSTQSGQQPDYSDQWIEYYLKNGRPDYAEQIIEMKKRQQQQQPSQKPQSLD